MQTQFSDWLAAERAAGRGGIVWPEPIVRGYPFSMVFPIPLDVSGDDFAAEMRIAPDAATAIATFTVTVGSFTGGFTNVTCSLDGTDELPADADGNGLEEAVFDLIYTPDGGTPTRSCALSIPISGFVTEAA